MDKIDLFKLHKADYIASKEPILNEITMANYLVINGIGAPGEASFEDAINALYAMAYTIKMTRKKQNKGDYVICKLEARYFCGSEQCLSEIDKTLWHWQLMIRTPSHVEMTDLKQAAKALFEKGKTPSVNKVMMIEHEFGPCIQMLHIGAYEDEYLSIKQMSAFAVENNLSALGEHCEIHISDPRRIPPERLKTILRMTIV
ncbi:GyrI-like domain-containing protein [Pseudoalteromonas denitrificans]|uniref:Uncharacterized protein n=1 Tax=Pseudoalteromonas denitrificans DSM 6059 TaxID=1123010 RepID=A0A1I1L8E3_9GAMM|nr:GyrI-like domain-containing protein [Pseudoalteromonas denitrificans]SFC68782.1 hypothetical protein SAMN02745724_02282 [Pseudoalteromonas denitrificans DSM 6059]